MKIAELIEKAKARANLPSDYALAKAIGVQNGNIANWKKGKRHPSNQEAIQLATLAGVDELAVIAQIELETANNEKKKEFWKHFLEARGYVATAALIVTGTLLLITPESSNASVLQFQNYGDKSNFFEQKIYIMRIIE